MSFGWDETGTRLKSKQEVRQKWMTNMITVKEKLGKKVLLFCVFIMCMSRVHDDDWGERNTEKMMMTFSEPQEVTHGSVGVWIHVSYTSVCEACLCLCCMHYCLSGRLRPDNSLHSITTSDKRPIITEKQMILKRTFFVLDFYTLVSSSCVRKIDEEGWLGRWLLSRGENQRKQVWAGKRGEDSWKERINDLRIMTWEKKELMHYRILKRKVIKEKSQFLSLYFFFFKCNECLPPLLSWSYINSCSQERERESEEQGEKDL